MDDAFSRERVERAYDVVAEDYQIAFGDDLSQLPLDRHMLDLARRSAKGRPILDLGCGTGSAGSYLSDHGAQVVGLDLSPGMLRSCRSRNRFPVCQGDMRCLPVCGQAFAAVVAYYSIQHVPRSELGPVLRETARILEPEGTLLLGAHLGEGEAYTDKFLGHAIPRSGGTLYSSEALAGALSDSGFAIETTEFRDPLTHEHQSHRIYVLAKWHGQTSN